MKSKVLKRIISLALVMVMMASTMVIAMVSASATTETKKYTVTIKTAGNKGVSGDIFSYELVGTKGTQEFKLTMCSLRDVTKSVECADLGEITSVNVKHWAGCDGLYLDYIKVKDNSNKETTFYGGRWVDGGETTLSKSDNVYKLTINTADEGGAGTNSDICVTLCDVNNKKSEQLNVTSIHPATDAFERGDSVTIYMNVPSDFAKLNVVEFHSEIDVAYMLGGIVLIYGIGDIFNSEWKLDNISAVKVSGSTVDINKTYNKYVNAEIDTDDTYKVIV